MTASRLDRGATAAAVLLVASIAAVVSFVHIEHLAITHGQTQLAAMPHCSMAPSQTPPPGAPAPHPP
jgi:hypothetical protein